MLVDQDILGLDVSMDDVAGVQEFDVAKQVVDHYSYMVF
jgi:hypothetical protein